MGGGTAGVEALRLGRRFIGVDINPVSTFVTRVKTTPLSQRDREALQNWAQRVPEFQTVHITGRPNKSPPGYTVHVPEQLEILIERLLDSIQSLSNDRQRLFARCSILKTAQWALDNRREIVSENGFIAAHKQHVRQMLADCFQDSDESSSSVRNVPEKRRLLCRNVEGLESDRRLPRDWIPVRLVLTSPPYPGVHVLYHRWQVQGRRETASPFWIVGKEDGHGSSHYTMGPRYAEDLSIYLARLESGFRSIAALLDKNSIIVQLLGFSDPEVQLGPVLAALESAGLEEVRLRGSAMPTLRHWRNVPNRKWHVAQSQIATSREVLLVHRLAS